MSNPTRFGRRHARTPPPVFAGAATVPHQGSGALPARPAEAAQWPFFTATLTCMLLAAFYVQIRHAGLHPSLAARIAEGGISRDLVLQHGQWWRLFTAPFLHASPAHITGNLIAFIPAAMLLERLIGRGWLACVYFIGGIGSGIGSIAYMNAVSVGASGAILCLSATMFIVSFHEHLGRRHARWLRRLALYVLVPSLMPSAAHGGIMVDLGAHVGGALTGIAMGALLLIIWPEGDRFPPHANTAATVGLLGIAATAICFAFTGHANARVALPITHLIPARIMPASMRKAADESAMLVRRYPDDPRAQLARGVYFLRRRDAADAEPHLRKALHDFDAVPGAFQARFRDQVQAALAVTLLAQGRIDAARKTGQTTCNSHSKDALVRKLRDALQRGGVCR